MDEVKAAYKRMAILFHPDKHLQHQEVAESLFQRIQTAYSVLSDGTLRRVYDEHGWSGLETYWQLSPHVDTNIEEILREIDARRKGSSWKLQRMSTQLDLDGAAWWLELEDALMPADYLPTIQHLSVSQEWSQHWTPQLSSLFSLTVGDQRGLGSLQAAHRLGYAFANGTRIEWALSSQNTQGAARHGSTIALQHSLGRGVALSLQTTMLLGDIVAWSPQASLSRLWAEKHLTSVTVLPRGLSLNYAYLTADQSIQLTWQQVATSTALEVKGAVRLDDQYSFKSKLRVTEDASQLDLGVIRCIEANRFSIWLELNSTWGVGLRLAWKRDPYVFTLPIRISAELDAQSIGWAVLLPSAIGWLSEMLTKHMHEEDLSKLRAQQQHEAMLPMLRDNVELVHELMRPTYEAKLSDDLVILSAEYRGDAEHVLDVKIPLTLLIQDGCLVLPAGPKDHLPGFIDVQLGVGKMLRISYRFRGVEHEVSQDAELPLRLPQRHHTL